MNKIRLIAILISLASLVIVNVENAVCPSQNSCQHNYGRKLLPQIQDTATYLIEKKVETRGNDPMPCCLECVSMPSCDYYYLEFANGNCTLFSLPNNSSFISKLIIGQYYQKVSYEGCCIGYPNSYLYPSLSSSNSSKW